MIANLLNLFMLLVILVIITSRAFDKEKLKAAIYSAIITLLLVNLMCLYFFGSERDMLIRRICNEIEKTKPVVVEKPIIIGDFRNNEVLNHKHKYSTGEIMRE